MEITYNNISETLQDHIISKYFPNGGRDVTFQITGKKQKTIQDSGRLTTALASPGLKTVPLESRIKDIGQNNKTIYITSLDGADLERYVRNKEKDKPEPLTKIQFKGKSGGTIKLRKDDVFTYNIDDKKWVIEGPFKHLFLYLFLSPYNKFSVGKPWYVPLQSPMFQYEFLDSANKAISEYKKTEKIDEALAVIVDWKVDGVLRDNGLKFFDVSSLSDAEIYMKLRDIAKAEPEKFITGKIKSATNEEFEKLIEKLKLANEKNVLITDNKAQTATIDNMNWSCQFNGFKNKYKDIATSLKDKPEILSYIDSQLD